MTFTGETATGRAILASGAPRLTPVSFELGGKSANVVFADADLDRAVAGSIAGVFHNDGQVCLAGSRILVERSLADAFTRAPGARRRARSRIGDPKLESTDVGPLVEAPHHDKVRRYVELGREEGAVVACGGTRPEDGALADGTYLRPDGADRRATTACASRARRSSGPSRS